MSKGEEFIEGNFPLVYKQMSLENRVNKLTKLVKPNQILEGITMPYPSHIFQSKVQSTIAIINQVLSVENDQVIDDLILGFIFSICVPNESVLVPKDNLAEYLEKLIHTQLVNFNSLRSFRYQTYLLNVFLF